jgi:hypothetical protein
MSPPSDESSARRTLVAGSAPARWRHLSSGHWRYVRTSAGVPDSEPVGQCRDATEQILTKVPLQRRNPPVAFQ